MIIENLPCRLGRIGKINDINQIENIEITRGLLHDLYIENELFKKLCHVQGVYDVSQVDIDSKEFKFLSRHAHNVIKDEYVKIIESNLNERADDFLGKADELISFIDEFNLLIYIRDIDLTDPIKVYTDRSFISELRSPLKETVDECYEEEKAGEVMDFIDALFRSLVFWVESYVKAKEKIHGFKKIKSPAHVFNVWLSEYT